MRSSLSLCRCKYWHYDDNLLTSSIVIVFHNEGWSTLMRTVHSVIKRTPRRYLAEIVMIDDFSNKGARGCAGKHPTPVPTVNPSDTISGYIGFDQYCPMLRTVSEGRVRS